MMQALVLHGVGDLRCEESPLPAVRPGQVRVRVGFCGVCGSDMPRCFVKGTYRFPTICGHEFAGVVESGGEGVCRFVVGDRVAVFPLVWCGRCPACAAGRFPQCHHYDYLGSRSDGAFAEYVVAPERNLIRVPDGVTLEEAAMTEPAAVARHALQRAGGCRAGETVAVFGAGPIGLIVAQWARLQGAGTVLIADIAPSKLALARRLGFSEWTEGDEADLCVEAAGVSTSLRAALQATRRGGRVVWLGNPSGDVTLPAELISRCLRREITIVGTWNSEYRQDDPQDDWHAALAAMVRKELNLAPLVTHRVPLSAARETLEKMRDRQIEYVKVLIHPDQKDSTR